MSDLRRDRWYRREQRWLRAGVFSLTMAVLTTPATVVLYLFVEFVGMPLVCFYVMLAAQLGWIVAGIVSVLMMILSIRQQTGSLKRP